MISDIEFDKIHSATIQILEQVGFHIPDENLLSMIEAGGLKIDRSHKCIKFSPEQVADAIKKSAKELCLYHHPKDSYVAFNNESRFMPSGTGVAVFDRVTGARRQSCATDVKDLLRLQDGLSNLDIARPMVTAVEFGDNSDLVECYLSLRYTGRTGRLNSWLPLPAHTSCALTS